MARHPTRDVLGQGGGGVLAATRRCFGSGDALNKRVVMNRLRRAFGRPAIGPAGRFETSADLLDHYVKSLPSRQTAIDAMPGWHASMPPESNLKAGTAALHADTRIAWLLQHCVDVAGKEILELGPLEGSHTYMLHKAKAASIDAIEANTIAFMRCLISKEVLGLTRANFYLGDFTKWLETTEKAYDLVVASGVLYHSHDPVHLLELIGRRTDAVFLWTHCFDEVAMPVGDLRRTPFSGRMERRESHGVTLRLYERSYFKAWRDLKFCGGFQDRHFWVQRDDILALLRAMGFDHVVTADEQPDHVNGPSFSVFAKRTRATIFPDSGAAAFGPMPPLVLN